MFRVGWIFASTLILSSILRVSVASADFSQGLRSAITVAGLSENALDILDQEIQHLNYKQNTVGIVDFTLPSSEPRFFVIYLSQSSFKVYPVSHATRSGGLMASSFSNEVGSNQSSLGFMRTGGVYSGAFGRSMSLAGLSPSNSNLAKRSIILHSAEYSSPEFLYKYGIWGRSFGCFAVPQQNIDEIIDALGEGALILVYHDKLWESAQDRPSAQSLPGASPSPRGNEWEEEENRKGDPDPHRAGDGPSSYYKSKYGALTAQ